MNADPQLILFLPLLMAISLTLLVMPFYPAWREWRNPTDGEALVVLAGKTHNIITTARLFRKKMLGNRTVPALVTRAISTFGALDQKTPIYTADDLTLRHGGKLTEFFTDGSLVLAAHSRVTGWAHAEKDLELGEGSVAVRQISSAHTIRMARGCCFEQLHAPVIYFGRKAPGLNIGPGPLPARIFSMEQVPGATPWGQQGWRVNGDCEIPEACCFKGALVVTGQLSIGAGAVVEGDLKAYKGILVGPHAQVCGAMFCEAGIQMTRDCVVAGPVVADTYLLVGNGCVLGTASAPTTITAGSILVGDGVTAHGTLWARQAGLVWGQE